MEPCRFARMWHEAICNSDFDLLNCNQIQKGLCIAIFSRQQEYKFGIAKEKCLVWVHNKEISTLLSSVDSKQLCPGEISKI